MKKMKKLIIMILFWGLIVSSESVLAAEEEYGEENIETTKSAVIDSDYSYTYDEDTKVLTISGNGPLPDFRYDKFYNEVLAPWRFVVQKAVKIVIGLLSDFRLKFLYPST